MAAWMTPRPALVFLGFAVLLVAAGVALLLRSAAAYLGGGHAVSSTSGDHVYRYGGQLLGYPTYAVGMEPALIAIALALVVVAVTIAALTHRRV